MGKEGRGDRQGEEGDWESYQIRLQRGCLEYEEMMGEKACIRAGNIAKYIDMAGSPAAAISQLPPPPL